MTKFCIKQSATISLLLFAFHEQDRDSRCRYPERYEHEHLAEYCYKMEVSVTSSNELTSVTHAEHIAMVLSALINSGGGVLIIHLVGQAGDIDLDMCLTDIVRVITRPEMWIHEEVFNDTVTCTKSEAEKEIYLFTNATRHLVTHNSNAYYVSLNDIKCIVSNDILKDVIRTCTCVNYTICEKHEGLSTRSQISSMLSTTDTLSAKHDFPVLDSDSDTHFYRNYQLNDRSLTDLLNTQSVQCDILELVSALANTKGGSIFFGVTNTATPIVVGYHLSEGDMKCTRERISDILTGRNPGPVTIWGHPHIKSTNYWKTFIHDVVGNEKKVIEICVSQCPGGMFCALPVCLDITIRGEIYQVNSFAEWKTRVLQGTLDALQEETDIIDIYHKHFEKTEIIEKETPLYMPPPTDTSAATIPKQREQIALCNSQSSLQFCWWLSDYGVVVESFKFDLCCLKELADCEMQISTAFSTFPSTESTMKRFATIQGLEYNLKEILQEHQSHTGVAVFLENVPDASLPTYFILKHVTRACHIFDIVILKEGKPPVIVSIFKDECDRKEAKQYCLKLGQLLKRKCSKYIFLGKSSMKLFFRCQLYFMGRGYENLCQEGWYPKDYQQPLTETLNIVRYSLARILLESQHIADVYGIMVRHVCSYQAKVILGRRRKVFIGKAIAGSGKTFLAVELARRIKHKHGNTRKISFICPSRGLAAFVQWQTKEAKVFESVIVYDRYDSQCSIELSASLFSQYTDIIVDDAHAIPVFGEPTGWTMYNALFSSLQGGRRHAYIFFDPDLQDYRGCIPDNFTTQLEALAARYVGKFGVNIDSLGTIWTKSSRICLFIKACISEDLFELYIFRQIPEDGVFFHNIRGRDANVQDETTTLLSRLSDLKQYTSRDITILTESQEDKAWVKEMLKGHYKTQDATQFPVKHVVVDTLENFEGLESPVILFIIPQSWGSGYVGSLKYLLCVATRAISRLEFLLPWDASRRQQDLAELKRPFLLAVCILSGYNYTCT